VTASLTRRAGLLGLLAALSACAAPPPPAPVVTTDPDPDPEAVYTPGPIPWENLTEEHKRRARQGLTRLGEDVPDDATLQARWMITPPAQQRFLIRRPPPPPPRPVARGRGTPARGGAARGTAPARSGTAPARGGTAPARRPAPPPPRR
jgi:hypothetical protein